MRFAFETLDVFTTTRFGGNPLAVILDARGLSSEQMQQIAIEFGYSETTFVLPPVDPQHSAQVRIFTTSSEVPFAGHPNVGTAFVLARHGEIFGQPLGDYLIFEEQAGLVAIDIQRNAGSVTGAIITAPQPLEIRRDAAVETVAACVSLDPSDIRISRHIPQLISVGLPFVVAELASREALRRVRPDLTAFAEASAAIDVPDVGLALFLYVATPEVGEDHYSARMLIGADEDPATGSASAALGAYLLSLDPRPQLDWQITIEQGVDMGRPSLIQVQGQKAGGVVRQVRVGGSCVPVMRGVLELDI